MSDQTDPEIQELLQRIDRVLDTMDDLGRRLTVLDLKLGIVQALLDGHVGDVECGPDATDPE